MVAGRAIDRRHTHVPERRRHDVAAAGVGERDDIECVGQHEASRQRLTVPTRDDAGDEAERHIGAQKRVAPLALDPWEPQSSVAERIGRHGERPVVHGAYADEREVADTVNFTELHDEDLRARREAGGRRDREPRGGAESAAMEIYLRHGKERETGGDRRRELRLRQ